MSHFKNLAKGYKYEHKERAQPRARAKLGLLEKKKDYQARSRNFNKKQFTLKRLREKAALRNEDEFHLRMEGAHLTKGRHVKDNHGVTDHSRLRVYKTQDQVYLRSKLQTERNKIRRLEGQLGRREGKKARKHHIVFVDSDEEAEDVALPPGARGEEDEEQQDSDHASWLYRELQARKEREAKIAKLLTKVERQKQLQGKGKRRKVAEDPETGYPIYRWEPRRKK